jgi:hypothetical protein
MTPTMSPMLQCSAIHIRAAKPMEAAGNQTRVVCLPDSSRLQGIRVQA